MQSVASLISFARLALSAAKINGDVSSFLTKNLKFSGQSPR